MEWIYVCPSVHGSRARSLIKIKTTDRTEPQTSQILGPELQLRQVFSGVLEVLEADLILYSRAKEYIKFDVPDGYDDGFSE